MVSVIDKAGRKVEATVSSLGNGNYEAKSNKLTAGTSYFFLINGEAENAKVDRKESFTTRGYPISILFVQNGKPMSRQDVDIHGSKLITNSRGEIMTEAPAGMLYVSLTQGITEYKKTFLIKEVPISLDSGKAKSVQKFQFDLTTVKSHTPSGKTWILLLRIFFLLLALVLLSIFAWLVYRKKQQKILSEQNTQQDIAIFWNQLAPRVDAVSPRLQTTGNSSPSDTTSSDSMIEPALDEVEDMFEEANRKHMFEDSSRR
jgi:hypothetical protein